MLSDRLAAAGLVALRFDYAGTGDSADTYETGVAQWVDSIRGAVAFLRSCGCSSVSLAGLRIGATLAATAAPSCGPLTSLVLWDPVAGRSFLREQRALQMIEIGPQQARNDGSEEALGFTYPVDVVSQMRLLKVDVGILSDVDFQPRERGACLLLIRPEQESQPGIRTMVDSPLVSYLDAPAQPELLSHRSFAGTIPRDTISAIASHVSAHSAATARQVHVRLRDTAVVGTTPAGREIVERFARIGPDSAFGVVTEVAPRSNLRPLLLCGNVAAEYHIGPGRAWVELARRAAGHALTTIRFDWPGLGDSARDDQYDSTTLYPADRREKVLDIVRAARSEAAGPLGMLGSCSGAWLAAAVGGTERLGAVWLINEANWTKVPKPIDGRSYEAFVEKLARRADKPRTWRARSRSLVKHHLPYPIWLALCRTGVFVTPELILADLAERGTKVRLLLSASDADSFASRRGNTGVARLVRSGADIKVTVFDNADHALFMESGRKAILTAVLADAIRDLEIVPDSSGS